MRGWKRGTLNLPRKCRCEAKHNKPVFCKAHRCYVLNGKKDR